MKKYGVIDLGTNTFHLLIATPNDDGSFKEIYRERRFIQLAENGIQRIGAAPFKRGLNAMKDYAQKLKEHQIEAINAIGTAALRTAENGQAFIEKVRLETGIHIQLISGSEEARLIHRGVLRAVPFTEERRMIMDIGGGSVEFIIANQEEVLWAQSFPIGVAVLFNQFQRNDPLTEEDRKALLSFLQGQLTPLERALEQFPTSFLVGASGTFDVLENLLEVSKRSDYYVTIPIERFFPFYEQMLATPLEERLKIEGIPAARAEMLIVALVLIDYVVHVANIQHVIVSAFAMKEGILSEMIA